MLKAAAFFLAAAVVAASHAGADAAVDLRLVVDRIVAGRRSSHSISRIWIVVAKGRWHRRRRRHAGALPRRLHVCGIDRRVIRRQLEVERRRRGLRPRRQGQQAGDSDRGDEKVSGLHCIILPGATLRKAPTDR